MNEKTESGKILHESYDFFATLPFIIQLLAALILLLAVVGFIMWFYWKAIKPTIDVNSYVKEAESKFELLKNQVIQLETTQKNIIYSKSLGIDVTNINHIDKLFFSEEVKSATYGFKNDIDYFIQGLMSIVAYQNTKNKDKLKTAIKYFEESLEIADRNKVDKKYIAEYYNYIGVSYDKLEKYIEALENFELSINAFSYEKPYYNRACSLAMLHQSLPSNTSPINVKITYNGELNDFENSQGLKKFCFDKSVESIEKALELDPSNYKSIVEDKDLKVFINTDEYKKLIETYGVNNHKCGKYVLSES